MDGNEVARLSVRSVANRIRSTINLQSGIFLCVSQGVDGCTVEQREDVSPRIYVNAVYPANSYGSR